MSVEFAEAAMGYCLHVPCIARGCPDDVEWWGDQHGCVDGALCDRHMAEFVAEAECSLEMVGFVLCAVCQTLYPSRDMFVQIRKI